VFAAMPFPAELDQMRTDAHGSDRLGSTGDGRFCDTARSTSLFGVVRRFH